MKANILIATLGILLLFSCRKSKQDPCFDSKKDAFKTTCCTSGANIEEYTFQGKTVYLYEPGNCGADMTSEVTNEKCETLGYLGGITGNNKINGEDFSKAKFKKTVWSN
ncbi:MAG: hypothetical protein IPG08_02190 [Sphingobacteriaceae bacterium]|nr:hypothetical protein [Sphingobacteriaceae bacterium]